MHSALPLAAFADSGGEIVDWVSFALQLVMCSARKRNGQIAWLRRASFMPPRSNIDGLEIERRHQLVHARDSARVPERVLLAEQKR